MHLHMLPRKQLKIPSYHFRTTYVTLVCRVCHKGERKTEKKENRRGGWSPR